jgi:hypothetical protein
MHKHRPIVQRLISVASGKRATSLSVIIYWMQAFYTQRFIIHFNYI